MNEFGWKVLEHGAEKFDEEARSLAFENRCANGIRNDFLVSVEHCVYAQLLVSLGLETYGVEHD